MIAWKCEINSRIMREDARGECDLVDDGIAISLAQSNSIEYSDAMQYCN